MTDNEIPVIVSLLDTDLYKLTMQAAVLDHFPEAQVEYSFTNRTPDLKFTPEAIGWLTGQIQSLGSLQVNEQEIEFLRSKVPYLSEKYLEFLKTVRLDPTNEVELDYNSDTADLGMKIRGKWLTTIFYEVPILALLSEAYFRFVDTNWNLDGQQELAAHKASELVSNDCMFSEFGTRRRRSYDVQKIVIEGLIEGANADKRFMGSSNVHFAMLYNLNPIGTIAHEWMMGVAAFYKDYIHANKKSVDLWVQTVGKENSGFALTDTFGTENFLKVLVPPISDYYIGVRQDSGDPVEYTKLLGEHYKKLGYAANSKRIVYSDSLDIEKCLLYKKAAIEAGLVPSFGIGTYLTNDFKSTKPPYAKSKPLNIVIKLYSVNGTPAIKISDNIGKNTGDANEVKRAKHDLGYTEHEWKEGDESNRWKK